MSAPNRAGGPRPADTATQPGHEPAAGQLGLDELMIVNPSVGGLSAVVLGEDGRFHQVEGLEDSPAGGFFLGDDGGVYRVHGLSSNGLDGDGDVPSRFFLGDDGTLYEVIPERPR